MRSVLSCRFPSGPWPVVVAAVALVGLLTPRPAAAQAKVVISQVYGGGGQTGAPYTHDFIELFNAGTEPVDMTSGWSVQYASYTGSSWSRTNFSGVIPPGGHFLIQEGSGGANGVALPTPDATGAISMASTRGKIALVNNQTALTGTCPSGLVDIVGWGVGTNCYQGSGPAPAPSATQGVNRLGSPEGCQDTPDNSLDFVLATPNPRNSATAKTPCGSCTGSLNLGTNYWDLVSLPCVPTNSTVSGVFGDDLGTYGTDWIVWERNESSKGYESKASGDSLSMGRGYWIRSLSAQTVDVDGTFGSETTGDLDYSLTSSGGAHEGCGISAGQCNMVGNPRNYQVCWSSVQVVSGGTPYSLTASDPSNACQDDTPTGCLMSRVAYKRNAGGDYDEFDGITAGKLGTLMPWDGFWVSAYASGLTLRIPTTAGDCGVPRTPQKISEGWYVRLIAESGALRNESRVLGQLPGSVKGYDAHDLRSMAPFASNYLTIGFRHDDWGAVAGTYSSDFHAITSPRQVDSWTFEVRSGTPDVGVTLGWEEAPADILARSTLVDLATGERVQPTEGGKYAFTLAGTSRAFKWELAPSRPAQAAPPNIDIDMAPVRPVRAADPNVSIDR